MSRRTRGFSVLRIIRNHLRRSTQKISREPFFALARLIDKTTSDYFIHIGKVLSGGTVGRGDDDAEEIDKGDRLDLIMAALGMGETELTNNTARSTLSTARQYIGAKYPGDYVVYANVKKEHIRAVMD